VEDRIPITFRRFYSQPPGSPRVSITSAETLIGSVVCYIMESDRMVHCHDMNIGQIYVCKECGLELKVEKNCSTDSKHPKGVSCVNCMHVCCGKDMVLRA